MTQNNVLKLLKQVKTKTIPHGDGEVEVKELTVNQVNSFMDVAKDVADAESFESNRAALEAVIVAGVTGMEDAKSEDMGDIPMATLKTLAEAVLEFNGLTVTNAPGEDAAGNG